MVSTVDKHSSSRLGIDAQSRLQRERRTLIGAFGGKFTDADLAEGWQERDSPSEEELRELEFFERDARRRRLVLVEEAIQRLRDNSYGRCVTCGKRISRKRLESDPAIPDCIACARELETPRRNHSL
jgi:RNA polymerase-binding transcription factor DksA